MSLAILNPVRPAVGPGAERVYPSIEDLFARAELAEISSDLDRALAQSLFVSQLRFDLEDALDAALVDDDLRHLSAAEELVRLLAA